jgi:hypothetical protein
MCERCCDNYNYFPSLLFGGLTGDYEVECPVQSAKWAEYRIVLVSNGGSGEGQVTVSGDSAPPTLSTAGTAPKLTDQIFFRGQSYFVITGDTVRGGDTWERITNSQKRLFARIDVLSGSGPLYVTAQFRVRVHDLIPGPIEQTPTPELGHQVNIARAHRINDQLSKAGIPERFH